MERHVQSTWRQWLAVSALGLGSFSIVTTELAPVGLLTPIAQGFGIGSATAGLVVTVYAWVGAAAALISATSLARAPRRRLLVVLMLVLALSTVGSGLSASFGALMVARVAGALAHGTFWAMIGALAAQIVPAQHVGRATAIIFGGVSAASVVGVPMASYLGNLTSWQAVFYAIGGVSLLVAAVIRFSLPDLEGHKGINVATLFRVARQRNLRMIFATTLLAITAHFTAFTYIEPFLEDIPAFGPEWVAGLLLVFGMAGLVGNAVSGMLIDRHLKRMVAGAMLAASTALGLLVPVSGPLAAGLVPVLLFLWGGAISVILVGLQTWIIREAGEDVLPASAINVALFNGSVGLGAVAGSAIIARTGMDTLYLIASALTLVGLLPLMRVGMQNQSLTSSA